LDRESAEALLHLHIDKEMLGRIEEVADKSTERTLTQRNARQDRSRIANWKNAYKLLRWASEKGVTGGTLR